MKFNEHNQHFWEELDRLVENSKIVIERPKGTQHPRFPEYIYPVDYGYVENTSSMDGGEIDIWVGTMLPRKIDSILCTFDSLKKDSEIKILFGCNLKEKELIYKTQNSKILKAVMIER